MSHHQPEKFFDGRHLEAARAIAANDIAGLRRTARSLEVDKPGRQEMTLLWYAIQEKRYDAIRTLIELGSRPDKQVVQGVGTALNFALGDKNSWVLASILDGGFPVDHATDAGRTLLYQSGGLRGVARSLEAPGRARRESRR